MQTRHRGFMKEVSGSSRMGTPPFLSSFRPEATTLDAADVGCESPRSSERAISVSWRSVPSVTQSAGHQHYVTGGIGNLLRPDIGQADGLDIACGSFGGNPLGIATPRCQVKSGGDPGENGQRHRESDVIECRTNRRKPPGCRGGTRDMIKTFSAPGTPLVRFTTR